MQLLNFPARDPEAEVQQEVINILERSLELAREGKATSAIVILLDGNDDDDHLQLLMTTDGAVEALGMLTIAQRAV